MTKFGHLKNFFFFFFSFCTFGSFILCSVGKMRIQTWGLCRGGKTTLIWDKHNLKDVKPKPEFNV